MSREPIKPIPKGILAARSSINQLAAEGRFTLTTQNPFWQETEILCKPFSSRLFYSRENLEIVLEVEVGSVFDSFAIEEMMQSLPIPINYSFSLEPQPKLTVQGYLAVTPETDKSEVFSFVKNTMFSVLMTAQVSLVTDSLTKESKDKLTNGLLPKANSLWDFGGLTESLLSNNG
jgi:hypothetical protein